MNSEKFATARKVKDECIYSLQAERGEDDAPRSYARGIRETAQQRFPKGERGTHPTGRRGTEGQSGADELLLSAQRRRHAEGQPDTEHDGGHGHRLQGPSGSLCRRTAPVAGTADGGCAQSGDGQEGAAGTADAGAVGHEGLSPRVPPPPGAVAGRQSPLGQPAAGRGIRQQGEGHHAGVLHHDWRRRRPAVSGR